MPTLEKTYEGSDELPPYTEEEKRKAEDEKSKAARVADNLVASAVKTLRENAKDIDDNIGKIPKFLLSQFPLDRIGKRLSSGLRVVADALESLDTLKADKGPA